MLPYRTKQSRKARARKGGAYYKFILVRAKSFFSSFAASPSPPLGCFGSFSSVFASDWKFNLAEIAIEVSEGLFVHKLKGKRGRCPVSHKLKLYRTVTELQFTFPSQNAFTLSTGKQFWQIFTQTHLHLPGPTMDESPQIDRLSLARSIRRRSTTWPCSELPPPPSHIHQITSLSC